MDEKGQYSVMNGLVDFDWQPRKHRERVRQPNGWIAVTCFRVLERDPSKPESRSSFFSNVKPATKLLSRLTACIVVNEASATNIIVMIRLPRLSKITRKAATVLETPLLDL